MNLFDRVLNAAVGPVQGAHYEIDWWRVRLAVEIAIFAGLLIFLFFHPVEWGKVSDHDLLIWILVSVWLRGRR